MITFKKLSKEARRVSPFLRAAVADTFEGRDGHLFNKGMTGVIAHIPGVDRPQFVTDDVGHPCIYHPVKRHNMHLFHIPSLGHYQ